jgi:hypothetical protein
MRLGPAKLCLWASQADQPTASPDLYFGLSTEKVRSLTQNFSESDLAVELADIEISSERTVEGLIR